MKTYTNSKLSKGTLLPFLAIALVLTLCLTACGDNNQGDPSHEHSFSEWTVTQDPTCTTVGKETRACSCKATESRDIPTLEHNIVVLPGKDPTPTTEGLTEGAGCSVCGLVTVAQEIIPCITPWDGTVADSFAKGTGSAQDPYIISNGSELAYLFTLISDSQYKSCAGLFFKISQDIHLGDLEWPYGIGDFNSQFSGTLDGNNHYISNFQINYTEKLSHTMIGLFPMLYNAYISDLGLKEFTITASGNAGLSIGGLSGYSSDSTITNCYAIGSIDATETTYYSAVGLLIGDLYQCTVNKCYSEGTAKAYNSNFYTNVGGLLGHTNKGELRESYSSATVYGSCAAGLVSSVSNTNISDCYATGDVYAYGYEPNGYRVDLYVGGLIGHCTSQESLKNCYATGNVNYSGPATYAFVGGLVGNSYTIENCYATGNVTATDCSGTLEIGGLAGSCSATTCAYATGNVTVTNNSSSYVYAGGFAGTFASIIDLAFATGDVYVENTCDTVNFIILDVGGFAGYSKSGGTTNCYATGDVTVIGNNYINAAGFIGKCELSMYDGYNSFKNTSCYATGNVTATGIQGNYSIYMEVGAFSGYQGIIPDNCLATGNITVTGATGGSHIGNFAGLTYHSFQSDNSVYDAMNISIETLDGSTLTATSNASTCKLADINNKTFYTDSLGYDPSIWNLDDIDFENGKMPTLLFSK